KRLRPENQSTKEMTNMRITKRRTAGVLGAILALGAAAAVVFMTAGGASGAESQMGSATALPRSETFYMSGNQWSPNNDLNPAKSWDYITGLVGFAYETPFRYDPLKDKFTPWLAGAGKGKSKGPYVCTGRNGVQWGGGKGSNVKALTAKDFIFTLNTLKIPTHAQNPLWRDTGLKSVAAKGNTVVFKFGATPGYQQFDFYRYIVAIVPRHVFAPSGKPDLASGNLKQPIVGTGPYLYQSGIGTQTQTVVWKKNPNWWATRPLG